MLAIALLVGATPILAIRLGTAMILIQFAIGTLNDLIDAPQDAHRSPAKPIPSGLISPTTARGVFVGTAVVGLWLVAPSGLPTLFVASIGLGFGVAYDLRLSRTVISWLPLSLALPLVPVYAWLGVHGVVPERVVLLIPIAVLAGAALATGNAIVDRRLDEARGRRTVAVILGPATAWVLHASGILGAAILAIAFRPPGGGAASGVVLGMGLVLAVGGAIGLRSTSGWVLRIAWGLEAAGVASLGVGWMMAQAGFA